jgi:hypothetical protein
MLCIFFFRTFDRLYASLYVPDIFSFRRHSLGECSGAMLAHAKAPPLHQDKFYTAAERDVDSILPLSPQTIQAMVKAVLPR